jgi:phosphonate transport system ATP-binding protein
MATVLQLENVCCRFGSVQAVSEVSFSLEAGERVALIGASGSGKTTLLRLMGAQLAPASGRVSVLGGDPGMMGEGALRELRAQLAFIPQDLGLVPNMRVVQNVVGGHFGRRSLLGALRDLLLPALEVRREIFALLERVGIAEKMYDRVDALSGGQQQRVAVARALFQSPAVLLADEPISAVDPARARSLLELLVGLCAEEELSLVVSMHQLELAREFFPRLVGMKEGKVLFDRATPDLQAGELADLYRLEEEGR